MSIEFMDKFSVRYSMRCRPFINLLRGTIIDELHETDSRQMPQSYVLSRTANWKPRSRRAFSTGSPLS